MSRFFSVKILDRYGTRGYRSGAGNSGANYVPVDNYLALLDEGRCLSR
jgi:hypothetical protein